MLTIGRQCRALGWCGKKRSSWVFYKHGDTVGTPLSPVDGYAYDQTEIVYEYSLYSTRRPGGFFQWPDEQRRGLRSPADETCTGFRWT